MTKKRNNYTQEFRDSAIKLITYQSYKISKIVRNLGINVSIFGRWRRESESGSDSIYSCSIQLNR